MTKKFRPVSKRADPSALGIVDVEAEKLAAATDEDGVIRLDLAYDTPAPLNESDKSRTVTKILEERGLADAKSYQKEHQLKAVHQMMINGASTTQIAEKLNITPAQARSLRTELNARMAKEVRTMDKNKVAGQALMFYDHIAAKALQIVNKPDPNDKQLRNKVEALKVALQSQTDKQKFLMGAGYWQNGLNQNGVDDPHAEGANDLRDILEAVLTGDSYEVVTDDDSDIDDGIELM